MSVVIIGGNNCMERRYIDLCKKYGHKAKVFTEMNTKLKRKIGVPDMLVLFMNTVSHKMVLSAVEASKNTNAIIEKCQSSSLNALEKIMESHGSAHNA